MIVKLFGEDCLLDLFGEQSIYNTGKFNQNEKAYLAEMIEKYDLVINKTPNEVTVECVFYGINIKTINLMESDAIKTLPIFITRKIQILTAILALESLTYDPGQLFLIGMDRIRKIFNSINENVMDVLYNTVKRTFNNLEETEAMFREIKRTLSGESEIKEVEHVLKVLEGFSELIGIIDIGMIFALQNAKKQGIFKKLEDLYENTSLNLESMETIGNA